MNPDQIPAGRDSRVNRTELRAFETVLGTNWLARPHACRTDHMASIEDNTQWIRAIEWNGERQLSKEVAQLRELPRRCKWVVRESRQENRVGVIVGPSNIEGRRALNERTKSHFANWARHRVGSHSIAPERDHKVLMDLTHWWTFERQMCNNSALLH
jgi:hypothetical protein